MRDVRDILCDAGYEDAVIIPGYDDAIIGITSEGAVVYDYTLMVAILSEADGIDPDEAREYIDYNVIRSLPYVDPAPVIMERIEMYE